MLLQQEVGEQSGKEQQSPSELPSSPTHLAFVPGRRSEVKIPFDAKARCYSSVIAAAATHTCSPPISKTHVGSGIKIINFPDI